MKALAITIATAALILALWPSTPEGGKIQDRTQAQHELIQQMLSE